MANPYLVLWCDPTKNKLYSGWQENTEAITPILKQGDNVGVEIHWVTRPQFGAVMQEVIFPPSAAVTLAIGKVDSAPTDGTFTITYGGNTTPDLAYDITATELDTALNNLASITAEGGVSVTKSGNFYRIVWNDRVNYTDTFTTNVDALSPTSETQFVYAKDGSAYANRIVLMKVRQSVIAGTTSFTATTSPQISITNLFANVWRVEVSPTPKDGVFTLTFGGDVPSTTSGTISYDDSSADIEANLNGLTLGTFTVSQVGASIWDITVPEDVTTITSSNGLIGFSSMYGTLNMNTAEVEEFLAGSETGTAKLEVQVDVAGEIQTLIQTNVTIINDLIQNSSFDLVDLGQVMPVDSVVRYDTSQALTSAEQLTARQNIDAYTMADITSVYNLANQPSTPEKAAMQNSVLPSSTNPFVTMSERNPFDQDLNTTDDVQFNTVTVGTNSVVIDGTSVSVSDGTDTVLIQPTGITFADSSVQDTAFQGGLFLTKAGNLSGLEDTSVARTNLGLGTMSVETASNYLSKSENLSGLSDLSISRTNLGLGTMALETATNYLSKSGNLSGLSNTQTARTNLGLGSMAVESASNYITVAGASQEIQEIVNSQIDTLLQQKQNRWSTWLYKDMIHDLTAFSWDRGDNTSTYVVKESGTKKGMAVPSSATYTYTLRLENTYSPSLGAQSAAFNMLWWQFATMSWQNTISGQTYTYNVNGMNNAKIVISDEDSLTSQNRIEIGQDSGGTYVSFWGIESNQFLKYYREFGDMTSDSIYTLIFTLNGFYFSNNLQPVDFGTNGAISPSSGSVGTRIYSCTSRTVLEQGNEHWIGSSTYGSMKYIFLVVEQGEIGDIGIQGMKYSQFEGYVQP